VEALLLPMACNSDVPVKHFLVRSRWWVRNTTVSQAKVPVYRYKYTSSFGIPRPDVRS